MLLSLLLGLLAIPFILLGLLLAFLGFHQVRNRILYKLSGCNIPSVPEKPFIGALGIDPPSISAYKNFEKYGPIFYSPLLHVPMIYVSDPDVTQHVLSKANLPRSHFLTVQLPVFWGNSLETMQHGEGHPWKKERRLVDPAFRMSNLRNMTGSLTFHATKYTEILLQYSESHSESFDFAADISNLTLDIISSCGFSHNTGLIDGKRSQSSFVTSLNTFMQAIVTPIVLLPYGTHLMARYYRKEREELDRVFYKVIDQRLQQLKSDKQNATEAKDLLDFILRPDEDGNLLSREELRNELFVFYLAGHETTANVLSWLIFMLCKHPEIERKLVEELEAVMGPIDGKTIVAPTFEQLENLEYMKMVINETLRMYPPITASARFTNETFEMKGFIFPKGFGIACQNYNTHHDPNIWPDPFKFDPERFSKQNSERHPYSFIPFSAGPRICIGKNFFQVESKMILATLLRMVTFELDASKPSGEFKMDPFVKANGVWVHPKRRIPG